MRCVAKLLVAFITLLPCVGGAAITTNVLDIPTRPGITQRFLYLRPDAPAAIIVVLTGGDGLLNIQNDGAMLGPGATCGPVTRNRQAFASHGYALALVDAASDGNVWGVADVLEVIRYLQQRDELPVWIVGGSSSAPPTASIAAQAPATLRLGMVIFSPDRGDPAQLALVRRITQVVYHPLDSSQFASSFFNGLTSAPVRQLDRLTGGTNATNCGYHLFEGIDGLFVSTVTNFIDKYNNALAPLSSPTAAAVEFYNASLDHYFLTHVPSEIALLDAGTTIRGWTRTGQSFSVYAGATAGASPVCRFYIPPDKGNSHFYGRGTAECDGTARANPTFVNEDAQFFYATLPVGGVCPPGTRNIYRVFSQRSDANHRYMVDRSLRDQMVAKGWLAEGDGADLVVMCSPL